MSWWTSPTLHPKIKSKFVVVFSDVFYLPNVKSINKPSVEIETKEYRLLNHTFNYPGNAKWKPVTLKFVDMNGMGDREEFFDTGAFLWQILNNTGYAYPHLENSSFREPHYRNMNAGGGETGGGHHISTKISFDQVETEANEHNTWRTITTPEKSSNIANSFGLGLEGKIDMTSASAKKQKISIMQVSPDGRVSEAWHLVNPIVKSINWGDLSYDSDELVEYELQIVYDWAILDREILGKLAINYYSGLPYKQFMKNLAKNSDIIKEEAEARAEAFVETNSPDFGEDPTVQAADLSEIELDDTPVDNRSSLSDAPSDDAFASEGDVDAGLGGSNIGANLTILHQKEDQYGSKTFTDGKPRNDINFEAMSENNPDTPIEFVEEGYRAAKPSPNITQPESNVTWQNNPQERREGNDIGKGETYKEFVEEINRKEEDINITNDLKDIE